MTSYKRILMAVPFRYVNEATVQQALALAQFHDAQLTLLGVVEEIEKEYENWLTNKLPQDLEQAMLDKQLAALQARVDALMPHHAKVDCQVAKGIPFVEIIRTVQRGGYDLLVLDAVTSKPGKARFMGSTTKHVLRKCPCPVLCVRGQQPVTKIVAAVDVLSTKADMVSLNTKVLKEAKATAKREQAELHVVYAQQPIGEPMLSSWGIGSADMLDGMEQDLLDSAKTKLLALVEEVCGGSDGVVIKTLLGSPRDVLPQYVTDQRIDLITMGTVCRTGIAGFLIGNTAESILSEVECSILALKPDGFISPVE